MGDPIYLDYNATTPVAAEVLQAVQAALRDLWGNASSSHAQGRRAREAVERARAQVGRLLGAAHDEVIFTSGGTESDNAAIVGVAEALQARGRHLVISTIEHPAVEEACRWLESRGFQVTRVPVDATGRVTPDDVAAALREDTTLVSVMHSNNETGVLQPIGEIAVAAHRRGVLVHTDAAQSVGKIDVRVDDLGVDLLTVAGHKLYAPKGVGALYLRRGTPFAGFLRGAGHEGGRRAGTENTPGIVGLGAACQLALEEAAGRPRRLAALRDRLLEGLRGRLGQVVVHGEQAPRLPNTLSAAFPGVDATRLLSRLSGVATAAGAACHSGRAEPSRVLAAMRVPATLALATLRLTLGRPTSEAEVDAAVEEIAREVRALQPTSR